MKRRKVLRKTIMLLLAVWVILLLTLYLTSGKFREHGIEILRHQLEKNLLTEIQIRKNDIHFSILRNFPNAVIELENIYVKSARGPDYSEFDIATKDTLLFAEKADLILDLWSLLTRKYVLKRINIEKGQINLLSDSRGEVNYNVWLSDATDDSLSSQVEYDIRKFEFRDIRISYIDTKTKFSYSAEINKIEASGSFKNEDFQFEGKVLSTDNRLGYEKYHFAHVKPLTSQFIIAKEGDNYRLREGTIEVFNLPLQVEGDYDYVNKTYSATCNMSNVALQRLDDSFIDLFASDLKFYPQRGTAFFTASISGNSRSRARMDVQFKLLKAGFVNRKDDIKISDLYTSGSYTNGENRNNSSSVIRVDTFHCISGESKLALSGSVQNLDSPRISAFIAGTTELKKLMMLKKLGNEFILDGLAYSNFQVNGKIRSIKEIGTKDLKAIKLKGSVDLEQAYIEKRDKTLPEVTVNGGIRLKNLMEIDLDGVEITTGQSQIRVNGAVDNLPQFSNDKSIFPIFRGTIRSREFHVEDFLLEDKEHKQEAMRIELPDSVYLSGDFVFDKFYFDNFYATHVTGDFQYRPKKLMLNGFNMYSQGGRIESYQIIEQKGDRIYTRTKAEFSNLNISDLFYAFNEFNLDVITHNNIDGTLTGNTELSATWDLGLNPVYDEIKGHAVISIEDGELNDYQPMMGLSRFIAIDELKHIKFDRMQMDIHIENENLNIAQTHIKSSIFAISGSGDHSFDNSYTYRVQLHLADVLWKKAKKRKPQTTEFGYVVDDGLGRTTVPLIITGKDTLYTVTYDRKTATSSFIDKLKKERDDLMNSNRKDDRDEIREREDFKLEWDDQEVEETGSENERKENSDRQHEENEEDEFIIRWEDE